MQFYLIRHGQSYVNLQEWTEGNKDTGLTDLGQQQATALAAWMPTVIPAIDVLYASTMSRARETAEAVAQAYDCNIYFDDRLREIGNNRHDHTAWPNDDLPRQYADYWSSERPFSSVTPLVAHGETWMHFRTRIGLFVEELVLEHREEVVVAVCHGGVVEAVFDHIFNIGPWRRCEIWDRNTGISHFEYVAHPNRETWRLHFHNRQEHLAGI
ncbi:MAG: histidine phosphatase family protein [Ardenticatenales bacterium]|nr:histidine phosphatase family protein [Ardenticatenales bacterium]